ncbi:hypothetical protein Tcan_12975 [Toxocara canis]|uniref:Craniofacial development protein 2 n=1 Tax=Toxocara canis TaxID=6265 RepID=A0A0B2UU20_TOXCA|nr:hypothetical protein Tcan_12975 [Toxocara canis]
MGDFNAKVGKWRQDEKYVGKFELGERNERGERLVTFAEKKKLHTGNSLFRKQLSKRWTWFFGLLPVVAGSGYQRGLRRLYAEDGHSLT